MEVLMVIIVLMLMAYASLFYIAMRLSQVKKNNLKKTKGHFDFLSASKEDVLVLLVIPAFYLNPDFGLAFLVFTIYMVVKSRKESKLKAEKKPFNSVKITGFNFDQDWEGGQKFSHKKKVLMGLDTGNELSWYLNDDTGKLTGLSDWSKF